MERAKLTVIFADIPNTLNLKAAVAWRGFFWALLFAACLWLAR